MGVYIPGMEMPMCCQDCLFNYHAVCLIATETPRPHVEFNKRRDNCPLVPVPEHGELIEREPILDVMRKERDRISETYGPNDEYVNCLNKYAISIVTSAKTIIPAEEGDT